MKALGKHFIIELFDCNKSKLNDVSAVADVMEGAVEVSGATKLKSVFHEFSPHGVSGVIVIAESHFSIHTWPEYGYCALDVFTCGDLIDSQAAYDCLKNGFESGNATLLEIRRGLLDLPSHAIRHKPIEDGGPNPGKA